jgi:hypothetical protein
MRTLEVDRRVPEDALPPSCNAITDGTNRIFDPASIVLALPLGRVVGWMPIVGSRMKIGVTDPTWLLQLIC